MLEYLQTLFAPYTDGLCETHLCEIRCLPPRPFGEASPNGKCASAQQLEKGSASVELGAGGFFAAQRQTDATGRCRYFGRTHLAKAAAYARVLCGTHDVYVGVLPRALARSQGAGGRDGDIHQAAWLWADIDADGASPADLSAFLRGMHTCLPAPQMCVLSGSGGVHVYWRLSAPVCLRTEEARRKFSDILHRLVAAIDFSGGGQTGIHADASARNPSRILRVPGTWNHKRALPTPVQGVLCAPADTQTLKEWERSLPCEPRPSARRRFEITRLSARLGGRDIDPVPSGLRAWAGKGYPEGQRHTKLTGVAAWLRRDTDLPEPLAHELFHAKAQASPGAHPLTETELEKIWQWA